MQVFRPCSKLFEEKLIKFCCEFEKIWKKTIFFKNNIFSSGFAHNLRNRSETVSRNLERLSLNVRKNLPKNILFRNTVFPHKVTRLIESCFDESAESSPLKVQFLSMKVRKGYFFIKSLLDGNFSRISCWEFQIAILKKQFFSTTDSVCLDQRPNLSKKNKSFQTNVFPLGD